MSTRSINISIAHRMNEHFVSHAEHESSLDSHNSLDSLGGIEKKVFSIKVIQ